MSTPAATEMQKPVIPVAGRSCEGCAMCCKLGTIQEVDKPDGQWCKHCSTRKRCDIYETRPGVCRSYYCYYMLSTMGEEWRPTTANLMVSLLIGNVVYVSVDPLWPEAWKKEPYFSSIRNWSLKVRVVVLIGLHALAIYPDRIDDLGLLTEGYFLAEVTETTPGGVVKRTMKIHRKDLPPHLAQTLPAAVS